MKTHRLSRMAGLLVPAFALLFFPVLKVTGQEVLDVLPIEGRNELFHDWLMQEMNSLSAQRKAELDASLASVELTEQRQQKLREGYRMLLGDLPEKTPLNPDIVRTLEMEGYNIDVLSYKSRPDHHVTANFYYPTTDDGPWPGILFTCGHYPPAKAASILQNLCILLVNHGFAVLIVDPICQGERYQIIDPATGQLQFVGESGTKQHTRLDVGAMLTGTSVVAYELWDNLRGIDYLCTRPEVDTARIGCTGSSGGGAQATYLSAYDERIKVAAVNSYIMNEPTLYGTIGPQTGSQNLSYEGLFGIDHPEYITMFAPKPFMILCGTEDFFDIEGTRETHTEAVEVYERLGVPEKMGYFEYEDGHGYSLPKREAATRWFRTWFYDDTTAIVEPTEQEGLIQQADSLQVTAAGQVYYEYGNERVVEQFNADLATGYAAGREDFWNTQDTDSCLSRVRELIMPEQNREEVNAEIVDTFDRGSYRVEKILLRSGNLTPVTGLMFVPDDLSGSAPAVLYVDGRGKKADAGVGAIVEQAYVDAGKAVFTVDVRGFGETADNPARNELKHGNVEHRNAVISGYAGKTLIGQRVQDISLAKEYLMARAEVDTAEISIAGIDRAGTAVLHAAALDPDFKEVTIRSWSDTSWVTMVETPTALNNLTHVVPSALKYYDLPDLVRAISPRPVSYDRSYDTRLRDLQVSYGELDPPFSSEVFDYQITNVTRSSVRITPAVYNAYANPSVSGGGSYSLGERDTTVQILVTAEGGVSETIYRVTIPAKPAGIHDPGTGNESALLQNYPNPFGECTTISYALPSGGKVTLRVINQLGQEMAVLVDTYQSPGRYELRLPGETLDTGFYFSQLSLDGVVLDSGTMSVIRN
jgi:cephalosporin-C deacetylase-like acetyl esterase